MALYRSASAESDPAGLVEDDEVVKVDRSPPAWDEEGVAHLRASAAHRLFTQRTVISKEVEPDHAQS